MIRLLLDANLSPETREFLNTTLHLDVTDLITQGLGHLRDVDVVALARQEARVIVTFDLDIAEIYHRREPGQFGVIPLRLSDQTVDPVNATLLRFFRDEAPSLVLDRLLVVIDERRVRVVSSDR